MEIRTKRVELFDTSLRDGMQQPNLEISVPGAVILLERMAAFGVQFAEIGFAGANQFVGDLTRALAAVDTGAMKLALFGRTRGRGARVEDWPDVQFMVSHKGRVPAAVVVVKSRLLDVERSLETTPEENLLMAYETIECLHQNGLEVLVDLEHAMDANCGRRARIASRSISASLPGHQFQRPSRDTVEGTSRLRTRKVSIKMPSARPMPMSRI